MKRRYVLIIIVLAFVFLPNISFAATHIINAGGDRSTSIGQGIIIIYDSLLTTTTVSTIATTTTSASVTTTTSALETTSTTSPTTTSTTTTNPPGTAAVSYQASTNRVTAVLDGLPAGQIEVKLFSPEGLDLGAFSSLGTSAATAAGERQIFEFQLTQKPARDIYLVVVTVNGKLNRTISFAIR